MCENFCETTWHSYFRRKNRPNGFTSFTNLQMFNRDVKTIGKHINNIFIEGELEKKSTVAKFATVQNEGGKEVERNVK